MKYNRKIILEDGTEYAGYGFGAGGSRICELVFNTSMTGYQEILSDPSYTYQAVVMTYPLIGNYGMAEDDYETETPSIGAMIVRNYNDCPSNFRSTKTLSEVMESYGIPGISGVDTRALTRSIRDYGTRKALITDITTGTQEGLEILASAELPRDAVSKVSRKDIRTYYPVRNDHGILRQRPVHIVAIDCGIKQNIIRTFNKMGCTVSVVPWNISAESISALSPDGVFISNGPGDPMDVPETIKTIRSLLGRFPIFGICLGHQIISLACGASTYKLKFGHRGGNHPVRDLETGHIEITSQNHSYAVDMSSLSNTSLCATHINLLDGTVEGVRSRTDPVFSVQYHPESAPGPQDSSHLFTRFIEMIKETQNGKKN